jgi:hypothetical protein
MDFGNALNKINGNWTKKKGRKLQVKIGKTNGTVEEGEGNQRVWQHAKEEGQIS